MKNTAKNALLFCVGKLPQAVLMLLLTLIPAVLLTISYRFVSVDFLIGRSENSEYRLRADEEKFLNTYRSLDTRRREMLASYAEGLRDLNG